MLRVHKDSDATGGEIYENVDGLIFSNLAERADGLMGSTSKVSVTCATSALLVGAQPSEIDGTDSTANPGSLQSTVIYEGIDRLTINGMLEFRLCQRHLLLCDRAAAEMSQRRNRRKGVVGLA